jgi:hypothetical protein
MIHRRAGAFLPVAARQVGVGRAADQGIMAGVSIKKSDGRSVQASFTRGKRPESQP